MCVVGTALGTANLGRNGGPRPHLIYLLLTVLCATHNCWCSAARSVGTGCRTAVVADLLQLGGVSSSTPDERHDAPSCTARAWSLLFALRDVHKLCETFTSSAQQVCATDNRATWSRTAVCAWMGGSSIRALTRHVVSARAAYHASAFPCRRRASPKIRSKAGGRGLVALHELCRKLWPSE